MGWEAVPVLLAVAVASAAGGFLAAGARQKKRRGPFLVGVVCGLLAGAAVGRRRVFSTSLGAVARRAGIPRPLRTGAIAAAAVGRRVGLGAPAPAVGRRRQAQRR